MFDKLFSPETIEESLRILQTEIPLACWETVYVTVLATAFAVILGLPLGVLLVVGEKDGINYHFMTVADFEDHLAHDQIVEHTKYCENYYGTLRSEIEGRMALGIPVILVIEVEGAGNIKKMYPGATTIFVLPPDMEELERRLRNRGTENEETIQRRLKRAETEIANSVNYDEHVVNVEVDSCAESIYSIIQFKLKHGAAE